MADTPAATSLVPRTPRVPASAPIRGGAQLPDDIVHNAELQASLSLLPRNYNFEVEKTLWRLRTARALRVALQFPEGLALFAPLLADILTRFAGVEVIIMADVTYGACCVDDLGAAAMGADFMVHYGHSCLVPIDNMSTAMRMLYVFVDIDFDTAHLVACVRENFKPSAALAVMGTIQFAPALYRVKEALGEYVNLIIPQAKPLSPGEVLGCTSPNLSSYGALDAYIFVADGRFHLESVMIHNPRIPAYRYDPYGKRLTREEYDTPLMHATRMDAIMRAKRATRFGLILGTLGRQGNPGILHRLEDKLIAAGKDYFVLLLSEITPSKLRMLKDVDAWIQVACPRLSIDWGDAFDAAPLLTPYEAEVALGTTAWREVYPMDYYARGSGAWTNYHKPAAVPAAATGAAPAASTAS